MADKREGAVPNLPEAIYQHPDDYALEHIGDNEDIGFFADVLRRLRPQRVLELASGDGRVTLPLAQLGASQGFHITGLELVPEMLEAAHKKSEAAEPCLREHLTLLQGDMRTWRTEHCFDLIITPCSSLCHLLTLEDRLAAWRNSYYNLLPGGRFIVDVTMPNLDDYVDSFRTPAREIVEIDLDTFDEATQTRLIRSKTTRYFAHRQQAHIRFLYDKYVASAQPKRSVSDFESHVYYPDEMHLLFMHTGFEVESVYGDYRGGQFGPTSPQMIFCGVRLP